MSVVSVARSASYHQTEVESALDRLLAPYDGLGGAQGFGRKIGRGTRVLLKPNFLRAAPSDRAVSPHPAVIRGLCERLLDLGAVVRIGDSPAFGTAKGVARANGIMEVATQLGVPLVEFRSPRRIKVAGAGGLTLQIDREVMDSDAVLNVCKLKAHQQLGMTGAVKNLFGCITGKRKPAWHLRLGDRENGFGEMLIEVYRTVAPVLNICDGIVAMEGNGPGLGSPRPMGLLLASEDGVALDTVAATIVGHPLDSLRVYRAAKALGVGSPELDDIEVLCEVPLAEIQIDDWIFPEGLPIFFNPARVAWSTAKQVGLMAKMRMGLRV